MKVAQAEERWSNLRKGVHYIAFNKNNANQFVMPSLSPTFKGVGAEWLNEDDIPRRRFDGKDQAIACLAKKIFF